MLYTGATQEKLMNLRPRNKDKELGPPSFRFGAKTGLERVYEVLRQRNSPELGSESIMDVKTYKKLRNQVSNDISRISNGNQKNQGDAFPEIVKPTDLVPSLHLKTHFKAATSVFMNHKGSLEDKDKTVEKILNDFSVKRNLQLKLEQENNKLIRIKYK